VAETSGWLVVVDAQRVFADPDSPWGAPRFAEAHPRIRRLVAAFGDRVVFTRFVAPAEPTGALVDYYEVFPFALQPPDAPLYDLVEDPGPAAVVTATTFGKWGPELAALVGAGPMRVACVATECWVVSTGRPAADAGVPVRVAGDAGAGSSDDDHRKALGLMGLYAPLVEVTTADDVLGG